VPVVADRNPSGRELEILKILWEHGPASVREVHEHMCPDGELAYNTVQTLLRIMDEKGLVGHEQRGRTFVYSPRHTRQRETSRLLDKVFDGALDQFVVSLINSKNVSAAELIKLEKIIADARRRKQYPRNKGKSS
jgi:BlaI family transcriptional regulator, penicillinase repressor